METLQRVYGVSFPDEQRMAAWEELQEEARAWDHRTIGKVRLPSAAALLCDQGSEPGCLNADVSSPLPVFCFPDTRGLLLSSFTLLPPVSTNLFPSCISIRF